METKKLVLVSIYLSSLCNKIYRMAAILILPDKLYKWSTNLSTVQKFKTWRTNKSAFRRTNKSRVWINPSSTQNVQLIFEPAPEHCDTYIDG